jgi:hypothetical protein
MRQALQVLAVSVGAAALVISGGGAASAHGSSPKAYTCAGGDFATGDFVTIPSGNYASITVTGVCNVAPRAVINVVGDVTVAAGAVLDAQSAPSTITVGHNVTAASGSLLGLGCQPPSYTGNSGHKCVVDMHRHSTITVNGNVTTVDANTVLLNGITVTGNVRLYGGGGDIPWAIKNNTIGGNLTVNGQTANWLGVLFNSIGHNATVINVTVTDPGDPGRLVFVVRNTIGWNLNCKGLAPGVSGGFSPGEVNVVGHNAYGQCASLV